MKVIEERPPQGILWLYRILMALVLALVLILLVGTVYGLVKKASGNGRPSTSTGGAEDQAAGEENIFSGIGTIRVSTAGDDPETIIITVAFPYDKGDVAFSEELVSRIQDFKNLTTEYLASFTSEELHQLDTSVVNSELVSRYNAILHLGKIRELYFLDYIWL
jgi:flagellar basal body-associated protein FliL